MIDLKRKNENRIKFLLALYQMSNGNSQTMVVTEDLMKKLDIDYGTEGSEIGNYWKHKNCVTWSSFTHIYITHEGALEAERIMEQSYEEKEYLILKELFDKTKVNSTGISSTEIAQSLELEKDEVDYILFDFKRKEWVWLTFGPTAQIAPPGVTAFDTWKKNHPSPPTYGDTYNTNFYAPSNAQIGGSGNIQNAQININPEFKNIIRELVELIHGSELSELQKEENLELVKRIEQLEQKVKTSEVKELAKSKIKLLETGLKAGELTVKAAPLIEKILSIFG